MVFQNPQISEHCKTKYFNLNKADLFSCWGVVKHSFIHSLIQIYLYGVSEPTDFGAL